MNEFITWNMLGDFVKLTGIVVAVTQFTKNAPVVGKIKTQYWSWFIAFILITLFNVNIKTFEWMDLVLYGLSAMFISTSANGIYAVGEKKLNSTGAETKENIILNEKIK